VVNKVCCCASALPSPSASPLSIPSSDSEKKNGSKLVEDDDLDADEELELVFMFDDVDGEGLEVMVLAMSIRSWIVRELVKKRELISCLSIWVTGRTSQVTSGVWRMLIRVESGVGVSLSLLSRFAQIRSVNTCWSCVDPWFVRMR